MRQIMNEDTRGHCGGTCVRGRSAERTSSSDGGKSADTDHLTALVPDFRLVFVLVFPCLCDVRLRRSTLAHISWNVCVLTAAEPSICSDGGPS